MGQNLMVKKKEIKSYYVIITCGCKPFGVGETGDPSSRKTSLLSIFTNMSYDNNNMKQINIRTKYKKEKFPACSWYFAQSMSIAISYKMGKNQFWKMRNVIMNIMIEILEIPDVALGSDYILIFSPLHAAMCIAVSIRVVYFREMINERKYGH